MDSVAVTVRQMSRFPGMPMMARRCGPDDGEGRANGSVPGCGGDNRVVWTWRR
jgi:hypothetical protein